MFNVLQKSLKMNIHTLSKREMPRKRRHVFNKNAVVANNMDTIKRKNVFRVCVEGNISSGKTTLIQYFQKYPYIDLFTEPIDKWRNVNGNNLLELLYSDIKRWNFLFQNYVQLTRFKTQLVPPSSPTIRAQIYERSVQNNRYCFVEMAHQFGYLSTPEYEVLVNWFETISKIADVSTDLIVYIRTKPDTCFNRMKSRARPEETPVTLEYLQQLHDIHEKWLISKEANPGANVLVLNGEKNIYDIYEEYEQYANIIMGKEPFKKSMEERAAYK